MAKFRTTKQRIEDELGRDIQRAQLGRVPALRTTLQNYTSVPVVSVESEKRKQATNEAGAKFGLTVQEHTDEEREAMRKARVNDTKAKERTQKGVEYSSDLFRQKYNETPNYNILERIFDKDKSQAYSQKSKMQNRYDEAVSNKLDKILAQYQASGGDKLPMLAGTSANAVLHPFQYDEARKEIEPLLEANGISFEELEDYYKAQSLAQQNKDMAEYAKEHPVLASGASVVTNTIGGIEGVVGGLGNYLEGKPLDSNKALQEYGKLTPTIRGTVKEGIGNPVGQTLYDVETSVADMLFSLALGGGNSAASLGIMATNAGGNTLNEQMDKNTDPWQKVATAAASGAIEAITEKLPLDNLFKMVNNPAGRQTAKELIMNVLKQAGTEAGEEAIGEIANTFVDGLVNGSESDYNQSVKAYMAQGMTEDQARLKAETDIAQNAAYSALVGGLSGGIMGGGATAINNANVDANNRAQVAGLRMDAMSDARAYDRAKTAQNNAINARIDALRGFDYNYNQNAEGDFAAQQSAQLAQMLEQAKAAQEVEQRIQQRLAQPQSDEEFQAGLNRQLAEALAQNQEQQEARIPALRQNVQQEQFMQVPQTNANDSFGMLMEIMQQNQAPQEQITQSPRDVSKDNAEIKRLTDQRNLFMEKYNQTQDPVAKSIADAIQLQIDNTQNRMNQAMQTEKVIGEGLDDFNNNMSDVVKKFGTDNTRAWYKQLNKALNEYVKTGSNEAIDKAYDALKKMDESMRGKQYAYNRGGIIAYEPESIWDVFANNSTGISKLARANRPQTNTTASTTESAPSQQNAASQNKQEPLMFKLTGKPVSSQFMELLDRLNSKDQLNEKDIELYNAVPEIIDAKNRVAKGESTTDHSAEMEELRNKAYEAMMQYGSANGVDENGDTVYNGIVNKGSRADLIFGLSGSGKSSTLVDPISFQHKSRLIDSDEAKKQFGRFYDDGWGSGYVHKDSKKVVAKVMADSINLEDPNANDNIVIPKVGDDYEGAMDLINELKASGYKVYVHFNDLPPSKAAGRNFRRLASDGRFVDLMNTSFKYGNKPAEVFERLVKEGVADGYSKVSNDVARGTDPKYLGGTEDIPSYRRDLRRWRESIHGDIQGRNAEAETGTRQKADNLNRTMAESAGIGRKTQTVGNGEKITRNADGSETLTFDPYADEPNSTQTSRNSMYRYFDDMPDVQKLIESQRKEGKFDKEVHTNKETLEKAEAALNENEDAVKQDLLSKEYIDEVDAAKSLMLARKLFTNGNMDEGSRFLQNLSYKASTPGRVLQMLGAMAGTGEGAIVKANSLIKEESNNYFNRPGNKSKKERCGKLATALKNIGNDHTNDPAPKPPKTYQQIKQGVVNELEKESSSVFDIFNDTDIDYLARMVERGYTADEIQTKLEERLATGSWDISNEDLQFVLDKFNEANKYDINSKKAAELQMEAYQRLADYLPDSSFMEKWNNWRYLAMLGNPRTHIRNLVGNFMFGNIVSSVADELGGALEATANTTAKAFGGKGFERTKTAALKDRNLVKASQKYGEEHAWAQLADVKNKYSDMKRDISSEKRIFKNRALEGYRKISGDLLTKSDELSLMSKYKRAMAGYLQANGKDASVFKSTNPADQSMVQRASDYAVRRAKEATFHEDNKIAEILTNWSNTAKSKGGVAGNLLYGLEEALIPFKKTPANILKQAIEYSPANAINMVENAIQKDPALFIENLSKTMTGSGIMVLGAILAAKGLLRAKGDEKEADLDKLTGEQDFSLNLGNNSFTLDWAAPAALPLFVGTRLYENYENGNGLNPLDALASVGDPLVEMSMLQGISNTIQSVATYDKKKNGLAELGMNIGYNYLGQAVPTIAGQIARSVDDTRRTTYTGKQGVADTVGKLINKTKNKIPGLSMTNEPYVDAWGETQENAGGNFAGRLLNNMIFPWYYSNTEKTDTEKELYRLNKETSENIVPKTAETSYQGEKMNPKDYTEYATIKGQDAQKLLGETIRNPRYETLDDSAKAELLSDMLLFSNAIAKSEMFDYDIAGSNTYKKKYEAYQRGGVDGLIDYITLKESMGGKTSMDATLNALESMDGLSDSDKVFYFKQGKKEYSKEAQYLDGINEKYAYDWYMIQNEHGKKKDDMIYGIYTSDLPEEEKEAMLNVLNMDKDELIYELTVGH